MAFDNFHQPALGEEGPKFCEECSGQVGTNLEYKISNAIDQMLCSNERTPLYFSVITSTDALQSGFSISCRSDGSIDLTRNIMIFAIIQSVCSNIVSYTCPQRAQDRVCLCHIPAFET